MRASSDISDRDSPDVQQVNDPDLAAQSDADPVTYEGYVIPEWVVEEVNVLMSRDISQLSGMELRNFVWQLGAENSWYGYYALDRMSLEQLQLFAASMADDFRALYVTNQAQALFVDKFEERFPVALHHSTDEETKAEIISQLSNNAVEVFNRETIIEFHNTLEIVPRNP
ncbi:hypothetical protein [Aliidiomarina sp. B3213]|uniref:hypothetical protein n=1 Tax=Aliidiomarina sp. B3213 TaxID=2249757 RepID=UPI000F802204|nr:hypothetical protein [Aliidiomarina sp. B3213]RTE85660.1 hypothetical protein DQX04_12245 [Aliidiomarina sp. B3213]